MHRAAVIAINIRDAQGLQAKPRQAWQVGEEFAFRASDRCE
jgi:hypothetical protein